MPPLAQADAGQHDKHHCSHDVHDGHQEDEQVDLRGGTAWHSAAWQSMAQHHSMHDGH